MSGGIIVRFENYPFGKRAEKARCVRRVVSVASFPEVLQAVRLSFRQTSRMTWVEDYRDRDGQQRPSLYFLSILKFDFL